MTDTATDFSAQAIERRFECGSWTSEDVRFCMEAVNSLQDWKNREAAYCPDGVRFENYIASLQLEGDRLRGELEQANIDKAGLAANLRDVLAGLKRSEAALERQQRAIERLTAPISDKELTPHLLGKAWPITEAFDALIASRAAAHTSAEKE